jgi:hypothetical protein
MKAIQRNIIIVVIAALVLFGGAYFLNQNKSEAPSTTSTQQERETVASLTIDTGTEKTTADLTEEAIGKTILEVTEEHAQIKKTGEGENAFVTEINGRAADSAKKEFWKLVVNGKDAEKGAGSLTVSQGDSITWEIDTFE